MKIAFYKGQYGTWQDKLICRATRSIYSHCELILVDGIFASASGRDGGIRTKRVIPNYKWDVFTVLTVDGRQYTGSSEMAILDLFNEYDGYSYDWLGAFGSWIGLDLRRYDARFCSGVCAEHLSLSNINITPKMLYEQLLLQQRLVYEATVGSTT